MAAQQGFSSNDFMNMQREAERRVMEMQRKAKSRVENTPSPEPPATPPSIPSPQRAPSQRNFLEMLNFKSLFEGKDTSLILMVLALLNSEDTDPLLMLALLYVMM